MPLRHRWRGEVDKEIRWWYVDDGVEGLPSFWFRDRITSDLQPFTRTRRRYAVPASRSRASTTSFMWCHVILLDTIEPCCIQLRCGSHVGTGSTDVYKGKGGIRQETHHLRHMHGSSSYTVSRNPHLFSSTRGT